MALWVSGDCTACGPELKSPAPLFKKKKSIMAIFPVHGAEEEEAP